MAVQVKYELRAGIQKNDTSETMTCYVSGLDHTQHWARLQQAMDALPRVGDVNPYNNKLFVTGREIIDVGQEADELLAAVTYSINEEDSVGDDSVVVISGWTIDFDGTTKRQKDAGHKLFYVPEGQNFSKEFNTTVEVEKPFLTMTATKTFSSMSPKDASEFIAKYAGKVNKSSWFGGHPHQWLCTAGPSTAVGGGKYRVVLKFIKILDPKKMYHEPIIYARDSSGKILPDLKIDAIPAIWYSGLVNFVQYLNGLEVVPYYDEVKFPF